MINLMTDSLDLIIANDAKLCSYARDIGFVLDDLSDEELRVLRNSLVDKMTSDIPREKLGMLMALVEVIDGRRHKTASYEEAENEHPS